MVLLEAMAAGCPIVSTNVGGIGTAIQHGINGSLVNSQDSDALAKEIVRVLKDKELRSKYAANGLDIFEKQFSAIKMTRQYEKLYLREI
jgi:glycosyltransferase involved in cell wall biosynthesis